MSVKINDISTPFGSGFAAISFRTLVEQLKEKYKNFVESTIEVSATKVKDTYYVYFNIPSKDNKKYPEDVVFYDVVFELTPPNSAWKTHENIRDYDVRVFNNNPRFMFTFNYAYNRRNALIKLPSNYYSKYSLKNAPKVRNPTLLLGIDENLYHAIMYMDKHRLFYRDVLDMLCDSSDMDYKSMVDELSTQDEKMKEVEDRDLRHRSLNRRKNSKVWNSGSEKQKIKNQLLEESRNLTNLRASNPEESKLLQTKLLTNLRSRLSLLNINKNKTSSLYSSSMSNTSASSLGSSSLRSHGLKSSL